MALGRVVRRFLALLALGWVLLLVALLASIDEPPAPDLRNSSEWHEAYATDGSGAALAAPGFLSWDTLAGELLSNLRGGVNPFKL